MGRAGDGVSNENGIVASHGGCVGLHERGVRGLGGSAGGGGGQTASG
jgi:hypothetical protein